MTRESLEIKDLKSSSIYILKEPEIDTLLSKCNPTLVDAARKDLKNGGIIMQVYHPYFLTSPDVSNKHFLTSCISSRLYVDFKLPVVYDYWILSYPVIPEGPTVYIVLKSLGKMSSNNTLFNKDA